MRKLECPGCGANLELKEDDRDFAFCEYCGAKIMLDDYRSTHRIVDEARLKEAETDQVIKLKQMEIIKIAAEQKKNQKEMKMKIFIGVGVSGLVSLAIGGISKSDVFFYGGSLLLLVLVWMLLLTGINNDSSKGKASELDAMLELSMSNKTRFPANVFKSDISYRTAKKLLEQAGFIHVECEPLKDITLGLFDKPDTIGRITLNGETVTCNDAGRAYSINALIVISYHSPANTEIGNMLHQAGEAIKNQFK